MKIRNYLFLVGIVFCSVSTAMASGVVSDEIEQLVSPAEEIVFPAEEIQVDEPVQQDTDESASDNIEEQPVVEEEKPAEVEEPSEEENLTEEEKPAEEEDTIQDTTTTEEQTVPAEEISTEQKEEVLSVNPQETNEETSVETVSEEESIPEKESKKFNLILSEFFDKCSDFFSQLWFDKIIPLKDKIVQYLPSKKDVEIPGFIPLAEPKKAANPKNVMPYYFLYPENYHENIFLNPNITNPKELLPYNCIIYNYEIEKLEAPKGVITPEGTTDIRILINAPSPKIEVVGKSLFAKLVVDIANNTLYKYDEDGFPLKAYLVATGARGNRTKSGLRIVTYKEKFPYKGAPANTKRILDPYPYGPYIIFLNAVNPKTGRQRFVDQFLHGNGNERSIGKKVSHGCMRTNNKVMTQELSKEVNRGDYVLLINPDLN